MQKPVEYVFNTKGLTKLLSSLEKIEKSFQALNTNFGASTISHAASDLLAAGKSLERAANNLLSSAKTLHSAQNNNPKTPSLNQSPKVPGLPQSALSPLARLQYQLQQLHAQGGAGTYQAGALQNKIHALQNPLAGFGHKLSSLIQSSRIGAGRGGLQIAPLVGRSLQLLNSLGPIGKGLSLAGTAAASAASALYKLTEQAAESASSFAKLGLTTGGTRGDNAKLKSIGGAIGLTPDQVGALAQSFQDKTTSDPLAKAFALSKFGTNNIAGPFGNQDYGGQLLKAAEGLRAIKDREEQIRIARVTGLEALLPLVNLSDSQFKKLGEDAKVATSIFSEKIEKQAADFQSSQSRVSQALGNLTTAFGSKFFESLTNLLNPTADIINDLAKLTANSEAFGAVILPIIPIVKILTDELAATFNIIDAGLKLIELDFSGAGKKLKEALNPNEAANRALNENAEATKANTAAMRELTGTFGRGDRLKNAIPSGAHYDYLHRSLQEGGFKLGFF